MFTSSWAIKPRSERTLRRSVGKPHVTLWNDAFCGETSCHPLERRVLWGNLMSLSGTTRSVGKPHVTLWNDAFCGETSCHPLERRKVRSLRVAD
jgi:hypothetical protein